MANHDRLFMFHAPLPEPVTLEDLSARLMLLTGYVSGALLTDNVRTESQREQDRIAAKALYQCHPYIRALILLAAQHPEEFRSLCPAPVTPAQ